MSRPALSDSPDLTDVRWNMIQKCWSAIASASMTIDFLKSELQALSGDDKTICGEREHPVYPIQHEDRPSPATSDSFPHITNAHCNEIQQCLPVDASASKVTDVSEASIDDRTILEERGHRQAYLDICDAEQRTTSGDVTHPTHDEGLWPPSLASSNATTPQPSSRALTALPLDPLNVLLFGETGIDKSSIIKLIVGQDIANTAPGAPDSMLKRTAAVTLEERRFELWEVSSSDASMGFFKRLIAKWRLRASYKRLHRDSGAPLLLYCMKGTSTPTASREYKKFTNIVSSTSCVSIAVVVGLEEYPENMDDWWTEFKWNLGRLGMQFSNHVCITSLSNDPNTLRCRETICSLIGSYASYVPPRHTS